jgi:hypothetical protein
MVAEASGGVVTKDELSLVTVVLFLIVHSWNWYLLG